MLSIPQDGMKEGCCIAASGDEASIVMCAIRVIVGATVASRGMINCTSKLVPLQGIDSRGNCRPRFRSISILGRLGRLGRGIQSSKLYQGEFSRLEHFPLKEVGGGATGMS